MHDLLAPSPDRAGTGSVKWDRYRGRDILPFWVADMDFTSAPPVLEALRRRVDHGVFGYTQPPAETVEATRDYLRERHGLAVPAEWMVWLPGLVPALNLAARAFGHEGGGVITATPVYPPFLTAPQNARVPLQGISLVRAGNRWTFDWATLEALDDGGLFLLCNPHNPVGTCFRRDELEALRDLARAKDWVICTDEIHCDLILEEEVEHVPFLSLTEPGKDRVLALYSPSKTYNLPGLACAYALLPGEEERVAFRREAAGLITEVNCFGYTGCAAAYRDGEPWRQELLAVLRANRDRVHEVLGRYPDWLTLYPMEATYLAWMDARRLPVDHPARFFEAHGVGLSDGVDFGAPGWLRLNFGCPPGLLEEGLDRMERALASVRPAASASAAASSPR
jgi:cystathionine beta-lyase